MRRAFAHDALLRMPPGADTRAPGAAITVELCGHWEHPPPCPLAPHHVGVAGAGGETRLRILFATEPEREAEVRERIGAALSAGEWELVSDGGSPVRPEEADHAQRLAAS